MYNKKEFQLQLTQSADYRGIYHWMVENGKDKIAMEYKEDGKSKSLTYGEYGRFIQGTAKNIREQIQTRDSFIGIKIQNSPEFCIAFWASLMAGKNVILLDARLTPDKTRALLKKAGSNTLLTTERIDGTQSFLIRELLAKGEETDFVWGNQVALCTSGTTANSKIFVHTGQEMVQQMLCLDGLMEKTDRWGRPEKIEKTLVFLPMHHVLGFVVIFMLPLITGNIMVFPEKIIPEVLLKTCREHHVTQVIGVPVLWNGVAKMLQRKIQMQGEKSYRHFMESLEQGIELEKQGKPIPSALEGLRKMVRSQLFGEDLYLACTGGGYILPDTLKIINGLGYYLVNGYGITETGILSVTNSENMEERLRGSVGEAIYPGGIKINSEEGTNSGEILVQNPYIHCAVMEDGQIIPKDYHRQEWFATGDVGHMTEGTLFIDGRIKDIIFDGSGENIYPDEVESHFEQLPGVEKLSVFGYKKGLYDETSMVLELSKTADEKEIAKSIHKINSKLPMGMQIKNVFISAQALPLSASMKIRRQLLKKEIEEGDEKYRALELFSVKIKEEHHKESLSKQALPYQKVEAGIKKILSRVLVLPEREIGDDKNLVADLGVDSLQSLTILTEIEDSYGIIIDREEYYTCLSPKELTALVYHKIRGDILEIRHNKEEKCVPVSRFEDSVEYRSFIERQESVKEEMEKYGNPYFVPHDSPIRDTSFTGGQNKINFGSYNYICMSGDPEVNRAAIDAIEKYGTSASGSRLLAGEKTLHKELEKKIAQWKHTQDAIVLVGGHSTNVTFVGNFCNEKDLILYDALSHNSVAQGVQLSKAHARMFPHNDCKSLENMLKRQRDYYEKVLIIAEGVYSMDGDVAPVPELVRLKKKYGCFLMIDEAHSAGVLGEHGGGVDEYFGLEGDDIDIKMGTLSKSLGACGGYLAGSHALIEYLRYNIPGFVFSVGLSPALAGAVLKALEILERDNSRVQKLQDNIAVFMREAEKHGFDTCLAGESAVTPILIGSDELAFQLSMLMLQDNIVVPPAVYPAVPKGKARLRYCLNSAHTEEEIIYALDILAKRLKEESTKQKETKAIEK